MTPIEKREDLLRQAIDIVCSDRNNQYGEPEDNFSIIGELWGAYLTARCASTGVTVKIGAQEAADMLILFKVARSATATTPKMDTYVDIAGYAACAGAFINEADEEADEKHTLTLEEKSNAIREWCVERDIACKSCPLKQRGTCYGYHGGEEDEKIVAENYDMIFGRNK